MKNQPFTDPLGDPCPTLIRVPRSARPGIRWAPLACTIALFAGCASAPPTEEAPPSAESYYQQALELLEGSRFLFFFEEVDYPRAIELFQEVIDNYPYSQYATLAELKIADVHFERGNFEEAASFYQDFVELHPTHERVPYAIYRNGLCHFEQMREPDQDQTATRDAVAHFQVLLDRHPDSENARDAALRLREAQDRLAAHETTIADFYFEQGEYHAAIRRYRRALELYPEHSQRLRTMARLATSLKRMQHLYEAEQLYHQVLAQDPGDEILDEVELELDEIQTGTGPGGARVLPRSCITAPNPSCPEDAPPN